MSRNTVIVYAKRTAIGRFCGALSTVSAPKLGAALVSNALETLQINPALVDEVLMGQVLQAGSGQAPARQAALLGGLPNSVAATTINKVCGSSLKTIMFGAQSIALGDSDVVFAGGQENMSLAPHLFMDSRKGVKLGSANMLDHLQHDGLTDPYKNLLMGNCGDLCAKEYDISREEQDNYALESYSRANKAIAEGLFEPEILPFEVKSKKTVNLFNEDEEPSFANTSKLKALRPVFTKDGTVTAGNASSINDGAALVVLMEEEYAKTNGFIPLAKIKGYSTFAHDPSWFTTAPIEGIRRVLKKTSTSLDQIDLFEINEAFSIVPIITMRELKISHAKTNIRGGAVSMGHPIGASGARIVVTLLNALNSSGKNKGLASICIGGGESCSLIIERCV